MKDVSLAGLFKGKNSKRVLLKIIFVVAILVLTLPLTFGVVGEGDNEEEIPVITIDDIREEDGIRFAIMADPHVSMVRPEANQKFEDGVEKLNDENVDFVLILGDLTDWGSQRNWEEYERIYEKFEVPAISVVGNHDYRGSVTDGLYGIFPFESWEPDNSALKFYYENLAPNEVPGLYSFLEDSLEFGPSKGDFSFSLGHIHVTVLDSGHDIYSGGIGAYGSGFTDDQIRWLEEDLDGEENIFLAMHHPIYRDVHQGDEDYVGEPEDPGIVKNLENVEEILSSHDVEAVLSGHLHDFENQEYEGIKHIRANLPPSYKILEYDPDGDLEITRHGEPFEYNDITKSLKSGFEGLRLTHSNQIEEGSLVGIYIVIAAGFLILGYIYRETR